MALPVVSGTEGYAEEAEALVRQYESLTFADVHRSVLHLLPQPPGRVLDVGAGTGRDAAALAAMGHCVTAVEPTAALRTRAALLHPSPAIRWVDDSLPDLACTASEGAAYEAVMLTAVWMHLDGAQRRRAMPRVAGLLRPGSVMVLSLRHGPVPPGRRMFDVTADETIGLAALEDLETALRQEGGDRFLGRPGVSWTRLAFRKPGMAEAQ